MAKGKLLFSVGIQDCRVDTFTVGGPGGGGKDTSNTGVRVVHEPSGAVGTSSDERSQLTNKRRAFRRMLATPKFLAWHRMTVSRLLGGPSIDERVDSDMQPANVKVEGRDAAGRWVPIS